MEKIQFRVFLGFSLLIFICGIQYTKIPDGVLSEIIDDSEVGLHIDISTGNFVTLWNDKFLSGCFFILKCNKGKITYSRKVTYLDKGWGRKLKEIRIEDNFSLRKYLRFWDKLLQAEVFSFTNYSFLEILDWINLLAEIYQIPPDQDYLDKFMEARWKPFSWGTREPTNYFLTVRLGEQSKQIFIWDPDSVVDKSYLKIIHLFESVFPEGKLLGDSRIISGVEALNNVAR
jgi:hypothetical protein